jgi:hypothetical protein
MSFLTRLPAELYNPDAFWKRPARLKATRSPPPSSGQN